jgi:DNA invertase Pin-like site-specific DNA recombinase
MTRRLRAVVLLRVSTVDQDVEVAKAELLRHAELRGFEVVEIIEEVASGAGAVRPGLDRVHELVNRRKVDVVLAWALDRVGRSLIDLLRFVEFLKAHDVTLCTVADALTVRPDGDAASELVVNVLGAAAVFERRRLVERTRLGLARARAKGKRLGRPRTLSPWEDHQVVALRSSGRSWTEVAAEVGCSVAAARRAALRQGEGPAGKGTPVEPTTMPEPLGANPGPEAVPQPNGFDSPDGVAIADYRAHSDEYEGGVR